MEFKTIKKKKLSVALATYNEEENISRCLESVKGLADEIIVVDGSSVDRTREIARKYGARIIKTVNPPIFHINKQKALEACSGEWILQLDADESLSEGLKNEIREIVMMDSKQILKKKIPSQKMALFFRHQQLIEKRDGKLGNETGEISAFFIPRRNYFLGRFLTYGGVYPDGVIRLFKKGKARFPCKSVHEQVKVFGRVSWLENDLLHWADPNFSRYLARSNRYTSLQAEEYKKEKVGKGLLAVVNYMVLKPLLRFFEIYFRHLGFKDGFPGFVWALYSGLHIASSYVKYWEETYVKK